MKFRIVLSAAFIAISMLGFVACGNRITKNYADTEVANGIYPKDIAKLLAKEYKESITAVGQATGIDRMTAIKKAQLAADIEIRKAFDKELAQLQRIFNDDTFSLFTIRKITTAKETTEEVSHGFTAFVLKAVSPEVIKQQIDAMPDADTTIKPQEAYKDLEARIEREKTARAAATAQ